MSTKRTAIKRPSWGGGRADLIPAGTVIEVGPRTDVRTASHRSRNGKERTLGAREVFVNGTLIGWIEQGERRSERPIHRNSRIVSVTGWPVEWFIRSHEFRRPRGFGLSGGHPQMAQAAYMLAGRYFEAQREGAES